MQTKRTKWKELNWKTEHGSLVSLDESSVNIDMTRRYGRAIGKVRVHCSTPLNTAPTQTVLASVRLNGQTIYTMYSGGTTGAHFLDYLKNLLIPMLHQGDIVVIDSMRSHHVKHYARRRDSTLSAAIQSEFEPDEMMWSKLKAILRKMGCRIAALLPLLVVQALALASSNDCMSWFVADGY